VRQEYLRKLHRGERVIPKHLTKSFWCCPAALGMTGRAWGSTFKRLNIMIRILFLLVFMAMSAVASQPPSGATQKTGASGNVANASAVATLAAVSAKTNYITGFQVTAAGATAASVVNVTVTGLITGTATYTFVFPAGVTTAAQSLIVSFETAVKASGVNTAIVVTLPAGGTGNTNAAVAAQGYDL
jgi:hypothetical protein